jgi:DNA (cytosine-5)-methyltransferase 1
MGYHRAGFDVVGVDILPEPRYPFEFHQADALKFLLEHHHEFDAFHASPPCQAYTKAQKIQGNDHPDFIVAIRAAFELIGKPWKPWVIENVEDAPLRNPIMLCGRSFPDLRTYRHRLFESNAYLREPIHQNHDIPLTKMGRPPREDEFMHVVGNFSGVEGGRKAMGIDWMSRDGLREAIPPAYTEFIGRQIIRTLEKAA